MGGGLQNAAIVGRIINKYVEEIKPHLNQLIFLGGDCGRPGICADTYRKTGIVQGIFPFRQHSNTFL